MTDYIPVKPLSANRMWQGRRFKTKEYDNWRKVMLWVMKKHPMIKGEVAVTVFLHLKSLTRSDIDNFLKPILDCLVLKGWIEDDRYIQRLEVVKIKSPNEAIEIDITKI